MFVCFAQQSFSSINNFNMFSINIFVTMTSSFPSSSTGTPQQQQQLQLERNPTRSNNGNDNCDTQTIAWQSRRAQNWIADQQQQHHVRRPQQQQQQQHVTAKHICHHYVLPSKRNRNTTPECNTIRTRTGMGSRVQELPTALFRPFSG